MFVPRRRPLGNIIRERLIQGASEVLRRGTCGRRPCSVNCAPPARLRNTPRGIFTPTGSSEEFREHTLGIGSSSITRCQLATSCSIPLIRHVFPSPSSIMLFMSYFLYCVFFLPLSSYAACFSSPFLLMLHVFSYFSLMLLVFFFSLPAKCVYPLFYSLC